MENNVEYHTDDNDNNQEEIFTFNFINQPWDDRSKESKILIISLLVAIFASTMALVIINLVINYRDYDSNSKFNVEIDCNLVEVDKYPFAARIFSLSTNEMICLGVVLSHTAILTTGLCLKFSPIRIQLGNRFDPRCKKGFSVDVVDFIPHDGTVTKTLALIITKENLQECSRKIPIGTSINLSHSVKIIGRPNRGAKTLSLQIADLDIENMTLRVLPEITSNISKDQVICVTGLARCPVRVGDILVQGNNLFGLASTSVIKQEKYMKIACFARIDHIAPEIKALDAEIILN